MPTARNLKRDHRRWQPLIDFARLRGWHVAQTPEGHLRFTKPGCARIYSSATASGLPATTDNDLPKEARHA